MRKPVFVRQYSGVATKVDFGAESAQGQIPALPLAACVSLDSLLNLSVFWFSHT